MAKKGKPSWFMHLMHKVRGEAVEMMTARVDLLVFLRFRVFRVLGG